MKIFKTQKYIAVILMVGILLNLVFISLMNEPSLESISDLNSTPIIIGEENTENEVTLIASNNIFGPLIPLPPKPPVSDPLPVAPPVLESLIQNWDIEGLQKDLIEIQIDTKENFKLTLGDWKQLDSLSVRLTSIDLENYQATIKAVSTKSTASTEDKEILKHLQQWQLFWQEFENDSIRIWNPDFGVGNEDQEFKLNDTISFKKYNLKLVSIDPETYSIKLEGSGIKAEVSWLNQIVKLSF